MIARATPMPAAAGGSTCHIVRPLRHAPVTMADSVARQAERNRMWPGSDARNSNQLRANTPPSDRGLAFRPIAYRTLEVVVIGVFCTTGGLVRGSSVPQPLA